MGLDLSAHRSRPATPALISAADLIIAMLNGPVRDVVMTDRRRSATFTLRSCAAPGRRTRAAGTPGGRSAHWLRRAHERRPADLLGVSTDDGIVDPTVRLFDHRATARDIDEFLAQLIDLVWPAPA